MFVIPCKFDPERPVVFDCVAKLREHHPNAKIVVIDSDSPDTSYLADLDCDTIDAENRHYGAGALKIALDAYIDDFFYLWFDSLLCHANLDDLAEKPLTVVRWFDIHEQGWGANKDGTPLGLFAEKHGVYIPTNFFGILGPMVFATRDTITRAGLLRIMPESAFEQCALERIWGIWLLEAGYDVRTCSLQGEMHGFYDQYPSERVEKIHMARC